MNTTELKEKRLAEELSAQIHGWDFSYLDGRMETGDDDLAQQSELLRNTGLTMIEQDEAFRPISFSDTGALI